MGSWRDKLTGGGVIGALRTNSTSQLLTDVPAFGQELRIEQPTPALSSLPEQALTQDAAVSKIGVNAAQTTAVETSRGTDAANSLLDILSQIENYAAQAANPTTPSTTRADINTQTKYLLSEYNRVVAASTPGSAITYNGSTTSVQIAGGNSTASVANGNLTTTLTNSAIDVTNITNATNAYYAAISAGYQTEVGLETFDASTSRLTNVVNLLSSKATFEDATVASIRDEESAQSSADRIASIIKQSTSLALSVHASLSSSQVIDLLN